MTLCAGNHGNHYINRAPHCTAYRYNVSNPCRSGPGAGTRGFLRPACATNTTWQPGVITPHFYRTISYFYSYYHHTSGSQNKQNIPARCTSMAVYRYWNWMGEVPVYSNYSLGSHMSCTWVIVQVAPHAFWNSSLDACTRSVVVWSSCWWQKVLSANDVTLSIDL